MSGYLLDTSALSLFYNRRATPQFKSWLDTMQGEGKIFVSVISFEELEKGAVKLSLVKGGDPENAGRISNWIRDLLITFEAKLLPIDANIALQAGRMDGETLEGGHTPQLADVLIGATALVHDLVVVTDNIRDFEALSVPCMLPMRNQS